MGSGYKGYINTNGAKERLKPKDLMHELENSNAKYNKSDIVMITKNYAGKLMWLEKGNLKSGLLHIKTRHGKDFDSNTNIPLLAKKILQLKPIKHISRKEGKQLADVFIYNHNGMIYLIAYGDNGYIVSFYPIGKA